ncbi:hypothetical protein DBV05_g11129 [Lasiodiplodia theobromae]|uniref:dihydroneopterin aldolase n=1 Tax=Lasiodiplodia theobromae TaxID=45133 RepID=A0A5N5CXW7_9PEZI|nr:hypothetical protein DBV05_g11129 [Lasiodiplodia theobromae]
MQMPTIAHHGRILRAFEQGEEYTKIAQYYAHEAAARWPATADTVSLSSLNMVVCAGRDVWGRTDRAQPLALSLTVASRTGFTSAAASDALDAGTVHYGHLSKNLLKALDPSITNNQWLSGLVVASRTSEALIATAAEGAGVEWTVFYSPAGEVVSFSRQLYVKGMAIPTLIGVNSNERLKKQMCLVSVWIDKVSDGAIDAYNVVEEIVLKAVENTSFETLEALAEKVAHVLFDTFIKGESSTSNLRVRIEKPSAVPLADFPAIEIYRTQQQVLHTNGSALQ